MPLITPNTRPVPRGTVQRPLQRLHAGPVIFSAAATGIGIGYQIGHPVTFVGDAAAAPRIWHPMSNGDVPILGFAGVGADNDTFTVRAWSVREATSVVDQRDDTPEFSLHFAFDLTVTLSAVVVPAAARLFPAGARLADTIVVTGADETLAPGIRVIHDRSDGGMALMLWDGLGSLGTILEPRLAGTTTGIYVFGSEA